MVVCKFCLTSNNDITNINNFIPSEDFDSTGLYVCKTCGNCCSDIVDIYSTPSIELGTTDEFLPDNVGNTRRDNNDIIVNNGRGGIFNKQTTNNSRSKSLNGNKQKYFKDTYKRVSHLFERIYQHLCREPEICREDMEIIRREYKLKQKNSLVSWCKQRPIMKKKNVQIILNSIDKKNPNLKFSNKYLEKWKSIRRDLTGHEGHFLTQGEINKVTALFSIFSDVWNSWQNPRDKKTKNTWVFEGRSHFLNFNYMFRRIFELCEIDYDKTEWLEPITQGCKNDLDYYFNFLLKTVLNKNYLKEKQTTLDDYIKANISKSVEDYEKKQEQNKNFQQKTLLNSKKRKIDDDSVEISKQKKQKKNK